MELSGVVAGPSVWLMRIRLGYASLETTGNAALEITEVLAVALETTGNAALGITEVLTTACVGPESCSPVFLPGQVRPA